MENKQFDEESSVKDANVTDDPIKQENKFDLIKNKNLGNDEMTVKRAALNEEADCMTALDVDPKFGGENKESVVISTSQESVVIPTSQEAVAMPIDQEAVAMPIDQEAVAMPIDQEAVAMPIDQEAVAMPIGQEAVAMPIGQEAVVMPIDQEAVAKPIDQEAVAMPIDQEAVAMPIDQEAVAMPIDQEAVVIPIDQEAVVMPIDHEAVVIPSGQEAVAMHIDQEAVVISPGQVQVNTEIEEMKIISEDRTETLAVNSSEVQQEFKGPGIKTDTEIRSKNVDAIANFEEEKEESILNPSNGQAQMESEMEDADLSEADGIKKDIEISSRNDDAIEVNPKFGEENEKSIVNTTPNWQPQTKSEMEESATKAINEDEPESSTAGSSEVQQELVSSDPISNSANLNDAAKIKMKICSKNDRKADDSETAESCTAEIEVHPEMKQIKVEVIDEVMPESWNVTNKLGSEYRVINVDSADDEASSSESEESSDDSSSPEEAPERNIIKIEDDEERVKKRGPVVLNSEIRTKGEIYPEDLPPLEELQITVNANEPMLVLGKVSGIVGILVIVQANAGVPALNEETALFMKERQVLGQVFETFGPVASPFYSMRFNSTDDINEKGISIGLPVYYAPKMSVTRYVFMQSLLLQRGSDASWDDSNEPPDRYMDYSDDEAERSAKSKRKAKHKADQEGNDEDEKSRHELPNKNRRNRQNKKQKDQSKRQEIFSGTSWPPCDRTNPKMARSHGSSNSKPSQDAERFEKQFQQGPRMPPYIRSSQFPPSQLNPSNGREQNRPQNGAMPQQGGFSSRPFGNNVPPNRQGVQMSLNDQQQFGFNQSHNRCSPQERPIFGHNRFSGQERPILELNRCAEEQPVFGHDRGSGQQQPLFGPRGCSDGPRFSRQGSQSFGPGRFQEGGQNLGSLSSGPQRHFQNNGNMPRNTCQGQGQNPGGPQRHFHNNGNMRGNTCQGQGNIFPPSGQQPNCTYGLNTPSFQNQSETMNSNQMPMNLYQNQAVHANNGECNYSNFDSQSKLSAPKFVDTRLMPNSDNM